jgi:DNA-binding NarL/FixJ family response regulator
VVSECGDGASAILQALAVKPDVILMDIGLAKMSMAYEPQKKSKKCCLAPISSCLQLAMTTRTFLKLLRLAPTVTA